jgi:hypothetical protein
MMGSVKALFASFWRRVGENDGGGCVVVDDIFARAGRVDVMMFWS